MLITFNQGINAAAVLGDDLAANGSRITVLLERVGGRALSEARPIAGAQFQTLFSHLNIVGEFIFTATQTFPSMDAALTYFFTQYAMLGTQDQLSLLWTGSQWFFNNSVLTAVERAPSSEGVKLAVRYTFQITKPTSTSNDL